MAWGGGSCAVGATRASSPPVTGPNPTQEPHRRPISTDDRDPRARLDGVLAPARGAVPLAPLIERTQPALGAQKDVHRLPGVRRSGARGTPDDDAKQQAPATRENRVAGRWRAPGDTRGTGG
jgi:hypothetical protein